MLPLVRDGPAPADILLPRAAGQDLDRQFGRAVVIHMARAGRIQIRLRRPIGQDVRPRVCPRAVMPMERPGMEEGIHFYDRARATGRAQMIAQEMRQDAARPCRGSDRRPRARPLRDTDRGGRCTDAPLAATESGSLRVDPSVPLAFRVSVRIGRLGPPARSAATKTPRSIRVAGRQPWLRPAPGAGGRRKRTVNICRRRVRARTEGVRSAYADTHHADALFASRSNAR